MSFFLLDVIQLNLPIDLSRFVKRKTTDCVILLVHDLVNVAKGMSAVIWEVLLLITFPRMTASAKPFIA